MDLHFRQLIQFSEKGGPTEKTKAVSPGPVIVQLVSDATVGIPRELADGLCHVAEQGMQGGGVP